MGTKTLGQTSTQALIMVELRGQHRDDQPLCGSCLRSLIWPPRAFLPSSSSSTAGRALRPSRH